MSASYIKTISEKKKKKKKKKKNQKKKNQKKNQKKEKIEESRKTKKKTRTYKRRQLIINYWASSAWFVVGLRLTDIILLIQTVMLPRPSFVEWNYEYENNNNHNRINNSSSKGKKYIHAPCVLVLRFSCGILTARRRRRRRRRRKSILVSK